MSSQGSQKKILAPIPGKGASKPATVEETLRALIASLNSPWGRLQLAHIQQEQDLLEAFAQSHANTYNFSSLQGDFPLLYRTVLQLLTKNRLLVDGFPEISPPHLYLGSVQCLRLLTRDAHLLRNFDNLDGLNFLAGQLKALTFEHFGGREDTAPFTSELLIEFASIVKKFTSDKRAIPRLVKHGLHATFSQLLYSRESSLLPLVLVSLTSMAKDPKLADQLAGSDNMEILVRMIDEYGPSLKAAAADLLNLLCRTRRGRGKILQLEGVSVLLQQLHSNTPELVSAACKILHCICSEPGGVQEIRQVGGIPIITNFLRSAWIQTLPPELQSKGRASMAGDNVMPGKDASDSPPVSRRSLSLHPHQPYPFSSNDERTFQLTACCAVLTRLSEDADCSVQITKCNAIYWLGRVVSDPLELRWVGQADEDAFDRGVGEPSTSLATPPSFIPPQPHRRGHLAEKGHARKGSLGGASDKGAGGSSTGGRKSGGANRSRSDRRRSSKPEQQATPVQDPGGPPLDSVAELVKATQATHPNPHPESTPRSSGGYPRPSPPTKKSSGKQAEGGQGAPGPTQRSPPPRAHSEHKSSLVQKIRDLPSITGEQKGEDEGDEAVQPSGHSLVIPSARPITGGGNRPDSRASSSSAKAQGVVGTNVALDRLWLMALRALRFLFSLERNRKFFKSLLPAEIFFAFIDVGHYEHDVEKYRPVAQKLETLGPKGGRNLRLALEEINTDRLVQDGRKVRGYTLMEVLGKGAYGCVYKAKRLKGETMVAIKEVALEEAGTLLGATEVERQEGLGQLCHEVAILSQMQHPNIVKYYESFVESGHVYIVMELMEGVSLMDHINRQKEMNAWMPEEDIWQVVISMVTAMNYLHSNRGVVHRDVTPNNIVLGQGQDALRRAKLTDFGLARQKRTPSNGSIIMSSMVGTMAYACPEIIQGEPYSEKADVWSLGCVLYHCVMRRPPFEGSNPLAVATRIVEGEVDPILDPPKDRGAPYSPQLKGLIKVLLTPDPNQRPGIQEVAALITPRLLLALDKSIAREDDLQRTIEFEKQRRKHSYVLYSKKKELFRRLLHEVQAKAEDRAIAMVQAAAAGGYTPRHPPPAGHPLIPTMPITPKEANGQPGGGAGVPGSSNGVGAANGGPSGAIPVPVPPPSGGSRAPGRSNSVQRNNMGLRVSVPPRGDVGPGSIVPPSTGSIASDGNGSLGSTSSPYVPPLLSQSSLGTNQSFSFLDTTTPGFQEGDSSIFLNPPPSTHASPKLPEGGLALGGTLPSGAGLGDTARHSPGGSATGSDSLHNTGHISGPEGATPTLSPHNLTWPAVQPLAIPQTARGATPPSANPLAPSPGAFLPSTGQPLPSARARVPAIGRTIAIAPERLRPVADPVAEVLQLMMKIRFVENAPPGSMPRDWRHRCIQRFSRQLFAPGTSVGQIKADLAKLVAASPEIIDMEIMGRGGGGRGSRPGSTAASRTNSRARIDLTGPMLEGAGVAPGTENRISYESLLGVIESVCEEMGYNQYAPRPSSHLLEGIDMPEIGE